MAEKHWWNGRGKMGPIGVRCEYFQLIDSVRLKAEHFVEPILRRIDSHSNESPMKWSENLFMVEKWAKDWQIFRQNFQTLRQFGCKKWNCKFLPWFDHSEFDRNIHWKCSNQAEIGNNVQKSRLNPFKQLLKAKLGWMFLRLWNSHIFPHKLWPKFAQSWEHGQQNWRTLPAQNWMK